ncbi:unnamed protein product [Diamesa serratosioi]
MIQFCCRICFVSDKSQLLLLKLKKDEQVYSDMVKFVAGIEINEHDLLPQHVCLECIEHIEKACEIKQKCIDADVTLRKLLNDELHSIRTENDIDLDTIKQEDEVDNIDEESFNEKQSKNQSCLASSSLKTEFIVVKQYDRERNEFNSQCSLCDEKFKNIRSKESHIKASHINERVCKTCKEKCKTAISLERHVKTHLHELTHMCHHCGKKYRILSQLTRHIKTSHDSTTSNDFVCDICGYNIKHRANLTRHMKSRHLKLKRFKCLQCTIERTFTTKNSLDQHTYNSHQVEAPYKCVACNRGFPTESNLRSHNKNFDCKSDKKRKACNSGLYVLEVKGEYHCKLCNCVYSSLDKFRSHYKSKHRFSLICNVCGQQMGNYTSLIRHKKTIHENLKPFKCPFCDKSFGQKNSLDSHRNTHTGDKPHQCKLCPFKTGDQRTIYKHQKQMHSELF